MKADIVEISCAVGVLPGRKNLGPRRRREEKMARTKTWQTVPMRREWWTIKIRHIGLKFHPMQVWNIGNRNA
jgi:hypothetical protein